MPRDDLPVPHQRARGRLEIGFDRRGLAHLFQSAPLRALFPTPEPGEAPIAAVVNTAGGLAGGDAIEIALRAGAGGRATISTPAAEKLYRSLGPETCIALRIAVEAGAALEWIPQETILFEGARLRRRVAVDLAADATLLLCETMVFGRRARGERFCRGMVEDSWRVWRDGALLWADGLALEDAEAALQSRFGFVGAEAFGTVLLAGPAAEASRDALRAAVGPHGGASLVRPGLLLGRWLGPAMPVRQAVGAAVVALRAAALGLPARLPRLWG